MYTNKNITKKNQIYFKLFGPTPHEQTDPAVGLKGSFFKPATDEFRS